MRRVVATVLMMASLGSGATGCGRDGDPAGHADDATTLSALPADATPAARARAVIARFTNEDLVGTVLMPYAYGSDATTVPPAAAAKNNEYAGVDTPAEMVSKYRLGGVILMGWTVDDPTASIGKSSNVDSPEQIKSLAAGLQAAAAKGPGGAPLLVGTDQEYGVVTRVRTGVVQLPSAMAFGAARDPARTEAAWRAAGGNLAALGINVDFAPVADVLGAQGSAVIGSRSYGSDPQAVAAQVAAATRGLSSAGVAAALKHFPGHGHTTTDSHSELPVLTQDRASLDRDDLPPFTAGIVAGAPIIMSGHLDVSAIDPGVPATFSAKVLIDLLRRQLGFTGVVVSDALEMQPARKWPPGEAAVRALVAGNDLLLMPPSVSAAQRGLLDGLASGALPRERLVEAATRVLTLRYTLAGQSRPQTLDTPADRAAALEVAAAAVTVLRGSCTGPLVRGPVTIAGDKWTQQRQWLTEALAAHGITTGAGGGTVRLIGYGEGTSALGPADVTIAMDIPTVLSAAPGSLVATYSASQVSMQALAVVLAGKAKAPGRTPVPVSGLKPSACA
jgi:beta-N-acetylhexosaminidase